VLSSIGTQWQDSFYESLSPFRPASFEQREGKAGRERAFPAESAREEMRESHGW